MTPSTKLIFLDIDGVLNSDSWLDEHGSLTCDPANVRWLNHLVKSTGADIVVSSDWRKWMSWPELCSRLIAAGVAARLVGTTPVIESDSDDFGDALPPRGHEVDLWLQTHEFPGTFVILDDRSDLQPHRGRLIQTHPDTGLTEPDFALAAALLDDESERE